MDWAEALANDFHPQRYTIDNVFRRLGHNQDPWADLHEHATDLAQAQRRLVHLWLPIKRVCASLDR